jgi:hypothetical protein
VRRRALGALALVQFNFNSPEIMSRITARQM